MVLNRGMTASQSQQQATAEAGAAFADQILSDLSVPTAQAVVFALKQCSPAFAQGFLDRIADPHGTPLGRP